MGKERREGKKVGGVEREIGLKGKEYVILLVSRVGASSVIFLICHGSWGLAHSFEGLGLHQTLLVCPHLM